MIEELAERLAHQKASMIDAALAKFLTEQGFETAEWNVAAMKNVTAKPMSGCGRWWGRLLP
jgi:predicted transcriptional regulator